MGAPDSGERARVRDGFRQNYRLWSEVEAECDCSRRGSTRAAALARKTLKANLRRRPSILQGAKIHVVSETYGMEITKVLLTQNAAYPTVKAPIRFK